MTFTFKDQIKLIWIFNPIRFNNRIKIHHRYFYQIKQFPNGNNTSPVVYPQRPPLTRIDSRNSFPIRPGFSNPQGAPLRPLGQQSRPPPPQGFIQRPTGPTNRPPFPPGFVNNQINPNLRSSGPNIRPPGGPFSPGAFPRGIPPGARLPNLIHQRSEPNAEHQRFDRDNFIRSQTLDSADINSSILGNANMDNKEPAVNLQQYTPPKSASSSLHSSNTNLNEEPLRTSSRNSSIDEKRFTNSQENLDKKSENEYPSRPESRSSSRMSQILENHDSKITKGPSLNDDQLPPRSDSRSSSSSKTSLPTTAKENMKEIQHANKSNEEINKTNVQPLKTNIEKEISPLQRPPSATKQVSKPEKANSVDKNKDSLQLNNLSKATTSIKIGTLVKLTF